MKLTDTWRCGNCDERGEGPKSQSQAQAHTNKFQHMTVTDARPENEPRLGHSGANSGAGNGRMLVANESGPAGVVAPVSPGLDQHSTMKGSASRG